MADAFTQQSSVSSDTTAYEAVAYYQLRPLLAFDALADVRPTRQTHVGAAVQFQIYSELAAATSTLSQTADPDSVAMADSTVTLTLAEYGNLIKTTQLLRVTSFMQISVDAANLIGYNAGLSLNRLARAVLVAGDNVRYSGTGTARNTLIPTDTLAADDARKILSDLKAANVMPVNGPYYWAFFHPHVEYDLRRQTGAAAWRDPHTYSSPESIWTGETGLFEGMRWVSTSEAAIVSDAGSSTTLTDVYQTIIGGKQALAIAHANAEDLKRFPTIVKGPMVDGLQRIQPLGWKWTGKHGRFREASLRRIESAASLGTNS